jgi:hypothetical protein
MTLLKLLPPAQAGSLRFAISRLRSSRVPQPDREGKSPIPIGGWLRTERACPECGGTLFFRVSTFWIIEFDSMPVECAGDALNQSETGHPAVRPAMDSHSGRLQHIAGTWKMRTPAERSEGRTNPGQLVVQPVPETLAFPTPLIGLKDYKQVSVRSAGVSPQFARLRARPGPCKTGRACLWPSDRSRNRWCHRLIRARRGLSILEQPPHP